VPSRRVVVAAVVVLAAVAAGIALSLTRDDPPTTPLTVTWGGGEDDPACRYDPSTDAVAVQLVVDGTAPRRETLTVTVTAYADENTSEPVGSGRREVPVEGTVHQEVGLSIAVTRPPHVDEDGVAACALAVDHRP
jgi:hypothetical protein